MKEMRGKVWKLGHSIDTDLIVPGRYLNAPLEEVKKHVFENMRPEFTTQVGEGDIIVAGGNFGCGSSRENAPEVLKQVGIACIVAESFARIFFRNAIAIGLPVAICPGVADIFKEGDIAVIQFEQAVVLNTQTGMTLQGEPFSKAILDIVENGGILENLKSQNR